jgi:DNA repair protein RecO (recombination protein O)
MEWRDKGILLAAKPFGETSLIIDVFTPDHGKSSGVVRGGQSKKLKPTLQIGAQLDLTWKARLEEHLGSFQVELIRSRTANVMNDRLLLAGMLSSATLINRFFPTGQVYKQFYESSEKLFDLLQFPDIWTLGYLKWELEFLETLGFGLDLEKCAVTGTTEDLKFISPKSGRAVSQSAAGEWSSKLLPFPVAVSGQANSLEDILAGLKVSQFFLEKKVLIAFGMEQLPTVRSRFISSIERKIRN